MSFLTGPEISRLIMKEKNKSKDVGELENEELPLRIIDITPFNPNPERMNPNSYNLCLGKTLKVYEKNLRWLEKRREFISQMCVYPITPDSQAIWRTSDFWMKQVDEFTLRLDEKPKMIEFEIPEEGMILWPEILYISETLEWTNTVGFAPVIEGRSSIARLDVSVHQTAGFGDNGFRGRWTLELKAGIPIWIKHGIEICQIAYNTVFGEEKYYKGRYQNQVGAVESRFWLKDQSNDEEPVKQTSVANGPPQQN